MWNYKQTLVIFILTAAKLAYASDISYDQQNITPQGWQEVDLSYVHKINGKDYIEQAKLLRPTSWLEQYHLDKVGRLVRVNESDVGIDATVRVVAVKSNKLYFESQNYQSAHPVIGTFLKYSDDVWSYTFTNGETIEATSNHPFYDVDKKQYIPIGEFQINGDQLLTDNNAKVQLYSKTKHNKGVEAVYNFEVYQAHNYYVSQNDNNSGVLVHNPNGPVCGTNKAFSRELTENPEFVADSEKNGGCVFIAGGCIAKYAYNKPVSVYITAHVQERSYAIRFQRWALGHGWDELPKTKVFENIGAKNIIREHFNDAIFTSDKLKSIVDSVTNTKNGEPMGAFIELPKHFVGIVGKDSKVIISDLAFSGKYWKTPAEMDYADITQKYHKYLNSDLIYSVTYMQ